MRLLGRFRLPFGRPSAAATPQAAAAPPRPAAEPAAAAFDLEYQRHLEALESVRRSIVEVMTSRKRLEAQADQLRRTHERLETQANAAVAENRDDLARSALRQALDLERKLGDRQSVIDGLRRKELELEASSGKLHAAIEGYRVRMEAARARRSAAESGMRAEIAVAQLSRGPEGGLEGGPASDAAPPADRPADRLPD